MSALGTAIHDLDISRWLMGSKGTNEPVKIYATGACNVDKKIMELQASNPSEAIDTANILIEFESGSTATIQVRSHQRLSTCVLVAEMPVSLSANPCCLCCRAPRWRERLRPKVLMILVEQWFKSLSTSGFILL